MPDRNWTAAEVLGTKHREGHNVTAYEDEANTFTQAQAITAAGTSLTTTGKVVQNGTKDVLDTDHNAASNPHTGYTQKSTLTTKGDLYVATASATPARLGVGTNGQVLTADSAVTEGVKWATPSGGGGGDIVGADGVGSSTAVNSTSDVTIFSKSVTGISAGDSVIVEADFRLNNNSGANATFTTTVELGGSQLSGALPTMAASATAWATQKMIATFAVSSTSLTRASSGTLGASVALGTATALSNTAFSNQIADDFAVDRTGTQTVALKVRSSTATATQTCVLISWRIRKVTAV